MKMKNSLTVFGLLLAATLWASLCPAQMQVSDIRGTVAAETGQAGAVSASNVDLRALRTQIDAFQTLLNRGMQQKFEQPFSLLEDAKGIYLPGYGVAFHMEINMSSLRLMNPFDMRPYTADEIAKAKESKLAKIRLLKTGLGQMLLEHGGDLNAMAPEQNLAIVVHLFKLPSESKDLPTQLVISVNRQTLLDYQAKRLTAEQFQNSGAFLEF